MGKDGNVIEDWTYAMKKVSLAAFVGFHNSNYTFYNLDLVGEFMNSLVQGNTVKTAFDAAVNKFGKTDEKYGPIREDHPALAYPLLRGDPEATLNGNIERAGEAPGEKPKGENPKQEEPNTWETAYEEVLSQYKTLVSMSEDERSDFFESGDGAAYNRLFFQGDANSRPDIRFALLDMDKDGKPELILGDGRLPQTDANGKTLQEASPMDVWVLGDDNKPIFVYRSEMISAIYGFDVIENNGKYLAFSKGGDEGWLSIRFVSIRSSSYSYEAGWDMDHGMENMFACNADAFEQQPHAGEYPPGSGNYEIDKYYYSHNDETDISPSLFIEALNAYVPAINRIEENDYEFYVAIGNLSVKEPVILKWNKLS
jgi:hypothetical protein